MVDALLSYADIIGMNYIPASAGIVLSAAEQTLASQAVAIFGFSEMWSDYDTYADDIEALMASTQYALLNTTIPPKENMNNRILLFPYMGTIAAGNAFLFTTAGAWQQNAPTNGSAYQIDGVILAAGNWQLRAYCYKQNSAGILKIDVKNKCIVTREGGEQTIINDVSSVVFDIEFMNLHYTVFKSFDEIVRECWR